MERAIWFLMGIFLAMIAAFIIFICLAREHRREIDVLKQELEKRTEFLKSPQRMTSRVVNTADLKCAAILEEGCKPRNYSLRKAMAHSFARDMLKYATIELRDGPYRGAQEARVKVTVVVPEYSDERFDDLCGMSSVTES